MDLLAWWTASVAARSNPFAEYSHEARISLPPFILSSVDPEAKCYKDAMSLLSEVAKVVKTDVDYETKKKYEDMVELEKLRINAIGEIGKGYAANRPFNLAFLGSGGAIATQSPIENK